MTKLFGLALGLAALVFSAKDPMNSSVQLSPLEVVRAWNAAFARNDSAAYFAFIDPEITVLTPSNPYRVLGIEADREEFEFSLQRGATWIGYFQMLEPRVQELGDTAVVSYYSRGSYGKGENAKTLYLKETDVLVRRRDGWKIVHIHVSTAG